LAFAIKVPMFPFHTWLPDAHTEAPTVGSVILAAVLLKMGTYGFLRFNMPLFPEAAHYFVPLFSILAIIGIVYGALVSMMQKDLKRLIAFSSVSHLGFVMLGLFTFTMPGVQGGIIQMINHGLSTGALFLIVGTIYERRHTRMISEFGGLCTPMPIFAIIFMIVTLSSIGLPGLNGFVGEFLILLGTFKVNKALRRHRRHRGHLCGLLHAVDVPAGGFRPGDQREEQRPQGPVLAGNRHLCAPDPVHRLDRGLSQHLFRQDQGIDGELPGQDGKGQVHAGVPIPRV
jgi:NADH:ubiquinone oxidoreductase subunit 5 (subunit L)/multisubunit Na+/H+ antiporter MnhA subunit